MAEKTTHYNLDILKGNDIYNPNIVFDNFKKIDTDMYNIDTNAVHSAVHILTGSVNTLTRNNTDYNIFKFVATAPYTANQTFTVDGKQVSAFTTNGQPLDSNCYVIGATVLCALNGSTLTLFVRSSGTAENALKLNNHPDTFFAVKGDTSKTLKEVDDIASARSTASSILAQKINNYPDITSFDTDSNTSFTLNNGLPRAKFYILFIYSKGRDNISGEAPSINYVLTNYDCNNYRMSYNQVNYLSSVNLTTNGITFIFNQPYVRGVILTV